MRLEPYDPNGAGAVRAAVQRFLAEHWPPGFVVAHGQVYHPHQLPGFIARGPEGLVGLVTYQVQGERCEIVTLDSAQPGRGLGTALVQAVCEAARAAGCRRVWLITTNDNLNALRFYQKRGFHLIAVHPDALTVSRRLKPSLPLIGADGLPLRDELELELRLDGPPPGPA